MKPKRSARKYLITSLVGILIAAAVFAARGGLTAADDVAAMYALCDAFFVPGVLILGFGLLVFCADDGLFDMINYGVLKAVKIVQSEKKRSQFPKTFYDYRAMKSETRGGGFGYLIVVGAVFVAIAAVFLLLGGV